MKSKQQQSPRNATGKSELSKAFQSDPMPLFSKKHSLGLLWSAKAGCTFATKWFFDKIGFLEAALFYSPWIHKFRTQVFYQSRDYKKYLRNDQFLQELLDRDMKIIKIVRNPYARAISSYMTAIKGGYEKQKISCFLNRDINSSETFSFREFVDYLGTRDLCSCNIHFRIQQHPIEKIGKVQPDYIVKLENSYDELNQVERDLGLPISDFELLKNSSHHSHRSKEIAEFCGDRHFQFLNQKSIVLPASTSFYDESIKNKVANLYKIDFESYGYSMLNID